MGLQGETENISARPPGDLCSGGGVAGSGGRAGEASRGRCGVDRCQEEGWGGGGYQPPPQGKYVRIGKVGQRKGVQFVKSLQRGMGGDLFCL